MMISCRRASELLSSQLERKLTTLQTVSLRLHLMMCSTCRLFRDAIVTLRGSLRQDREDPQAMLLPEAKERIRALIEKRASEDDR